jgi:hypothetical protein
VILALIDQFNTAADLRLAEQRQNVIDAADATRQMVDDFLDRVGDPLDILADSNTIGVPAVVDHLANIETNTDPDNVEDIGDRIANAIVEGFGSADINVPVTVVINTGSGLVTE